MRVDRFQAAVAALAATATLAGCGGGSAPAVHQPTLSGTDLSKVSLTASEIDSLSAADGRFATALFSKLVDGQSDNVVMSPASVAICLEMAYAGARGKTAAEMANVLRVDGVSPLQVAAAAAHFHDALAPLATDKNELLSIANKVWVQSGFPLVPSYDAAMRTGFGAGLQRTDFVKDPEGARNAINADIAAATRDKIQDLIPEGLIDDTTRLVLTNAVYLHAKWAHPFDPDETMPRPFHLTDGQTTNPQTLHEAATLEYVRDEGYQAVRLPYAGGRLAMTILLPDGALGPLEDQLVTRGLAALMSSAKPTDLTLDLPKFKYTWSHDLHETLAALGMPTAFSDAADFSGISREPLKIAFVQHKAFVAVDEKGTEAAAATAGGMVALSLRVAQTPTEMRVDHPFLFAITDTTTGLPLFIGQVTNPTVNG